MVVAEGVTKLLYVVVVDGVAVVRKKDLPSFRYTRSVLQSSLQLMGCKINQRVFETMRQDRLGNKLASDFVDVFLEDAKVYPHRETGRIAHACLEKTNSDLFTLEEDKGKGKPFELYKRRTTLVRGNLFLNVVCGALSEYMYVGLNQRADLI